jgi:molybdopterin molybdotransferase
VLAAVGKTQVRVYAPPRVAIFTTGDEVVPPSRTPGPGQIRNSNSASLISRLVRDLAQPEDLGILPDEVELMRAALRAALGEFDIVLLTGGVSMGDKDLVGQALHAEDFHEVFHRVNLKPGKPALFGTSRGSLVFGLPGNPVSVAVTYEILVRPVVRYLLGFAPVHRPRVTAQLVSPPPEAMPREQFIPAQLIETPGGFTVKTVSWHGSGDLFGFAAANCLLRIPAGGPAPLEGEPAGVIVIEESLSGLLGRLAK